MARTDPQLNIRIPASLKDALDAVADKNKRSTTAEIVARLSQSFDAGGDTPQVQTEVQRLQELVEAQRKTVGAQEINIIMLATHIIDLINGLPKRMQDDPHVRDAAEFALSLDIGEKILGFHSRTGIPMQVTAVEVTADDAPRDGIVRFIGGSEAIQSAERKRLDKKSKKS